MRATAFIYGNLLKFELAVFIAEKVPRGLVTRFRRLIEFQCIGPDIFHGIGNVDLAVRIMRNGIVGCEEEISRHGADGYDGIYGSVVADVFGDVQDISF